MIPGESSRSEAVSTKAKYTAMHQNEMGERRAEGGWVKVKGKRERKKGENVSDSVCVGKEICTRDTVEGAKTRKNNGEE